MSPRDHPQKNWQNDKLAQLTPTHFGINSGSTDSPECSPTSSWYAARSSLCSTSSRFGQHDTWHCSNLQFQIVSMSCDVMRRAMLRSVRCCGVLASICVKICKKADFGDVNSSRSSARRSGAKERAESAGLAPWLPMLGGSSSGNDKIVTAIAQLRGCACSARSAPCAAAPVLNEDSEDSEDSEDWSNAAMSKYVKICQNAASEKNTMRHDMTRFSCDKVQKNTSGSIALTDD